MKIKDGLGEILNDFINWNDIKVVGNVFEIELHKKMCLPNSDRHKLSLEFSMILNKIQNCKHTYIWLNSKVMERINNLLLKE